jgi:hypothetical protein
MGHKIAYFNDISDSNREVIIDELKILETRKISIFEKINKLESKLADMYSLSRMNGENIRDKTILLEQEKFFLDEKRILPPEFNKFLTINFSDQAIKTEQCIPDKNNVTELPITTDQQKDLGNSGTSLEKPKQDKREFNLLIVGFTGCGKTSLIKELVYGIHEYDHTPINETKTHILNLSTNRGNIKFNIYEGKDTDKYPKNVDCAIIMYDETFCFSVADASIFPPMLKSYYGDIPIVICGNKWHDPSAIHVLPDPFGLLNPLHEPRKDTFYCSMDVRNCSNIWRPFVMLTINLLSDPHIMRIV